MPTVTELAALVGSTFGNVKRNLAILATEEELRKSTIVELLSEYIAPTA
jgi:hypothetical protein